MHKPVAFPPKLARVVVEASGGECTLEELIDPELIHARFVWTNPALQRRGYEYALIRAANRMAKRVAERDRVQLQIDAIATEIAEYEARIAALSVPPDDAVAAAG